MRKLFVLLFINIVLGLMQTAFFPALLGSKVLTNWVLAFGLSWLLVNAPVTALKSVFLGGIILDILLGNFLGVSSLIMTLGIYCLILVRSYLFKGVISHFVIGSFLAFVYYLFILGVTKITFTALFFSLLTALMSVFISFVIRQIISNRN